MVSLQFDLGRRSDHIRPKSHQGKPPNAITWGPHRQENPKTLSTKIIYKLTSCPSNIQSITHRQPVLPDFWEISPRCRVCNRPEDTTDSRRHSSQRLAPPSEGEHCSVGGHWHFLPFAYRSIADELPTEITVSNVRTQVGELLEYSTESMLCLSIGTAVARFTLTLPASSQEEELPRVRRAPDRPQELRPPA